ncbi:MAG TPA: hypothetical protein VHE60_03375 [Pyrinomonadaceae bacterium]|nr:hypothetical protein [Pyrinomonadaceae bacterium]
MTELPAQSLTRQQAWSLKKLLVLLRRYPFKDELREFSQQLIRTTKQEAMRNPRASLLLKLISEADRTVPLVSICVLRDATQSLERLRPQLEPVDLLISLESTRGEARARALIRAYRETAEWLYEPYLRILWPLANFALKDYRPEPKYFGQLVIQLSDRLQNYPGLVDAEAAWRRNGAAHNHWKYEPNGDLLTMWDDNVSPKTIAVDKLIERLNDMYQLSGPTLERVAQLYLFRNVLYQTGLLDALFDSFPRLLSLNEAEMAAAEKETLAKAENAFGPLKKLLEANGYTWAAAN